MMEDDLYWYWFCGLEKTGIRTRHRLLKVFVSAKEIFEASEAMLENLAWMKKEMIEEMSASKNIDALKRSYDLYYKKKFRFIHIFSPEYPKRLKNIYEYPIGLYVKGKLPDDRQPTAAIVGARYCTVQGRGRSAHMAKVLAKHGVQVISGMALGIDGSAHRGALEAKGYTCAVLGSGIDVCYPKENWGIYEKLSECGGCISEYPPGTKPLPWRFPMRNRIIAGLSDAVVIVEARQKSGALITADYALEQGKDVFVIPGRPEDALSRGCNDLIKAGAGLVEDPWELMKMMGIKVDKNKKNNILLDKSEKLVYSSLCLIPKNIEDICSELQMDMNEAFLVLNTLEKRGLVRQVHKNQYVLDC